MRNKGRIEPFLGRVNICYLLTLVKPPEFRVSPEDFAKISQILAKDIEDNLKDMWLENPDLRFTQLLSNAGYFWFDTIYDREEKSLLKWLYSSEIEATLWGVNYDKDGNRLEHTEFRFIDQLETSHLITMINEANIGKRRYSLRYLYLFEKELNNRGVFDVTLTSAGIEIQKELNL